MILTETEAADDAVLPVQRVAPVEPDARPPIGDLVRSALRTQNTVGSLGHAVGSDLERIQARTRAQALGDVDPNYDPFADLAGYEQHATAFRDAETREEVTAIKRRIDREREDRRVLDAGGMTGLAAQVAAGVVDPINLVPIGGAAARSLRLSEQVVQGALRVGAAGGLTAAAAEAALHASQETRTAGESAIAVGAGTLLSGLLGAAAPLVREAIPALTARLQRDLNIGTRKPTLTPGPDGQLDAANLADALETSGAAGAMRVNLGEAKLKGALGVEKILAKTSPGVRAVSSPNIMTRRTAQELVEMPFHFTDEAEGIAAPIAAETRIKFWNAPLAESLSELDRLFVAHRQSGDLPANVKLSRKEFNEAVGKAMREGDEHFIPEVQSAARTFRAKVFDPLKVQAIKLGLLPEDVAPKGAPSYFSRVYNVQKITAERPDFVRRLTEWMTNEQYAKLDDVRAENARAMRHATGAPPRPLEGVKEALENQGLEVTAENVAKVELLRRARAVDPAAVDAIPDHLGDVEYMQRVVQIVDRKAAEPGVMQPRPGEAEVFGLKDEPRIDPLELRATAEDITDHILGVADGRIAYESVQLARGPLKERVLDVPDFWIQDYLENNVETIARMYTRTMASDVEIARAFGSVDMATRIDDIKNTYQGMIDRASTDAERIKLDKRRKRDIDDLAAMRDRLRGTYAAPADPSAFFVRAGRVMRNGNYLSLMGSMTVSSLPDLARPVMVHGVLSVLRDGIVPMVANFKAFKMATAEAKLAGTALDMVLDSRAMDLADVGNVYGRHSTFERGLQALVDRYGMWTLQTPWNSALKQFSSVLTQHGILRAALDGEKMTQRQLEKLAFGGIDAEMAGRIADQFRQFGEEHGGVMVANTRQWTDREAVKNFRAAVVKDVDSTIVTPGAGDKALWTSTEFGKVVTQFQAFQMASAQRILLAGLQQRDMAVLNGALLSIGLGMVLYALHSKGEKKEPADEPGVWVREGIDRSGIIGWLFEAANVVEKFTRGQLGPRALSGGEVSLRYADRDIVGALLGPSIGRVQDVGKAIGGISTGDMHEPDVKALRRLVPFQNLFYMRWLFDQAQESFGDAVGAGSH